MVNDFDRSYFRLGEGFRYGRNLVEVIDGRIVGRCAGAGWDMGILAQAVLNVAGKDYLEIGSYFGGSLIVAGLTMKHAGYEGKLVSVDPFDPDYPWRRDVETGEVSGSAVLTENVGRFGLEYRGIMLPARLVDWVAIRREYNLGVIYIDGGHDEIDFKYDLAVAVGCLPDYIVVDNVDTVYPHILAGVVKMAADPVRYRLVHLSGITAVLEKVGRNE